MKKILKFIIGKIYCVFFKINTKGKNNYIGRKSIIRGGKNIKLEDNISIRPDCFIHCNKDAKIEIKNNVDIGTRSRIVAAKRIIIKENVLIGPNVYIADQDHKYSDINTPIMRQGVKIAENGVVVGENSWLGINSVIVGNVSIGKNCVIGANTVVNRDIPDYSVAVGAPCRIIKKYDEELKKWVKI